MKKMGKIFIIKEYNYNNKGEWIFILFLIMFLNFKYIYCII